MPCPNTARLRKRLGIFFGIRDWFLGRHYFEGEGNGSGSNRDGEQQMKLCLLPDATHLLLSGWIPIRPPVRWSTQPLPSADEKNEAQSLLNDLIKVKNLQISDLKTKGLLTLPKAFS